MSDSESWNCIVICRRIRGGVDEVLLQWESCWIPANLVPTARVVEVLLRRTVRGEDQMLVQWACTWSPVELCDAGAVADYDGDTIIEAAVDLPAVVQTLAAVAEAVPKVQKRRVKRKNW
jgi:hypothetical protein